MILAVIIVTGKAFFFFKILVPLGEESPFLCESALTLVLGETLRALGGP